MVCQFVEIEINFLFCSTLRRSVVVYGHCLLFIYLLLWMASDARVSGIYRLKWMKNVQIMFGSLVASVFPDSFHFCWNGPRTMRKYSLVIRLSHFCCNCITKWLVNEIQNETHETTKHQSNLIIITSISLCVQLCLSQLKIRVHNSIQFPISSVIESESIWNRQVNK